MKKVMIIFLLCLSIILVGCNREEQSTGDIKYVKDVDLLTNSVSYDIDNIHINIKSNYEGMKIEESIFSYMINDNNGMYIVEYKGIKNDAINENDYLKYEINDKNYLYNYNDDYMNIIYVIDNRYLLITVENLNNEFNDNTILFLFNQLYFEVLVK